MTIRQLKEILAMMDPDADAFVAFFYADGTRETFAIEDELVASFANRLNLLKYREKIHAYAASLPLERTSKRGSDHAHFVRHTATACHAFF